VAKVSRINIAITGDSKGLQAATDSARRELNRLNAAAETTSKKLKGFGESAMRVQGVAGQFGVKGTGLGMLGGAAMLGSMGGMGLGLGAAGLAIGGLSMGAAAVQGLPDVRKRALQALEESRMDQRRRIEESGFSRQLAEAIAAQGAATTPSQNMGIFESLQAGMAAGPQGGVEFLLNEMPKFGATALGALLSGQNLSQAGNLAAAQISTGDTQRDIARMRDAQEVISYIPIANMLQYFLSK
jgi:hypothetical protein